MSRLVASGRGPNGAGLGYRDGLRRRFAAGAWSHHPRLRGHYFAIGSIGVVEVVRLLVVIMGSLTGGGDGLNLPLLSGGPNAVGRIFLWS